MRRQDADAEFLTSMAAWGAAPLNPYRRFTTCRDTLLVRVTPPPVPVIVKA